MSVERRILALNFSILVSLILFFFSTQITLAEECGCVLGGAVINTAPECLNDSTALVVDCKNVDNNGWQYSADSGSDGVTGSTVGGGVFEIYGMAFRETLDEVWIVMNSNLPMAGSGDIAWSDLFINLTNSNFLTAHNSSDLYGIRFADNNDSAVTALGVYSDVSAVSVASQNGGFASWGAYASNVTNNGKIPTLGDFGANQTYYDGSISINSINSATYLGGIDLYYNTTASSPIPQLTSLGYNPSATTFAGKYTVAIRFQKRLIIDECGVIGGDGTTCMDCAGVVCGKAKEDICGICDGPGYNDYECCGGEEDLGCGCGEPGPSGCDQQCGSEKEEDVCGVCDGPGYNNDSCCGDQQDLGCGCGEPGPSGCDNECGSTKEEDECGVCGGPGLNEYGCCGDEENLGCGCGEPEPSGCDNECGSTKEEDVCGVCGGPGYNDYGCCGKLKDFGCGCGQREPTGCDNECGSTKDIDKCGVCGGEDFDLGCDGVCFSDAVVDKCGICGGDDTTCGTAEEECVEQAVTKKEKRSSREVRKAAKVLLERTDRFVGVADECGANYDNLSTTAKKLFKRIQKILRSTITNTVLECFNDVCTKQSTGKIKRKLRRVTEKLYRAAKDAKVNAIGACQLKHEGSGQSKVTEDYRDDLLNAIKKLPKKKTVC